MNLHSEKYYSQYNQTQNHKMPEASYPASGIFFNKLKSLGKALLRPGLLLMLLYTNGFAQNESGKDTIPIQPIDGMDVIRNLFNIEKDTTSVPNQSNVALLPSVGYNPSFGFVIGANMSVGKHTGSPENTGYSVVGLGLIYTSKGIFTIQARHNIFTPNNVWNFQGNWQLSLYGLVDYSLGTGKEEYCYSGLNVNDYPISTADSAFPIKYDYLRFFEKGYRRIGPALFAGVGVSFDVYTDIKDEKQSEELNTPHQLYSLRHDYSPNKYSANGLILAIQYNTREHPIRSYGGMYFDFNLRFDQKWMGSTKNAIQVFYDFRKYWSLSKKNPEHVIAVWHWANYKLSGELPYLQLPNTGSDTYNRSGRAYTIGRFRGLSYAIFEGEYRYPITRNKLISGVVFFNMQSASDDLNQKIFEQWNGGGGLGLRILFQKNNRSAVCVDFSRGNCGSHGIFFGLNEVF